MLAWAGQSTRRLNLQSVKQVAYGSQVDVGLTQKYQPTSCKSVFLCLCPAMQSSLDAWVCDTMLQMQKLA